MKLTDVITLERPIYWADLETTGLSAQTDRIVQIGLVKIDVDGTLTPWSTYVNPCVHIPEEATAAHNITDDMVRDAPRFEQLAHALYKKLDDVDVGSYNGDRFDIPFFKAEFKRCHLSWKPRRTVDVFRIYGKMNPRNLASAVREYVESHPDLNRELTRMKASAELTSRGFHDALFDVMCTHLVFVGQLLRHSELQDVANVHKMFNETVPDGKVDVEGKFAWKNGQAVIAFGKHNGKLLRDVPRDYLEWMATGDFPEDAKRVAQDALFGKYPVKS